mmetsp:Transcript_41458/g.119485  ORF Transcript_41458/g.119485 Transcript_41458/m.119485 type:complete len:234 (-) Transcript_41458:96-797(-)
MPMAHLKECPWDGGQKWRPARMELAATSQEHRGDLNAMRNFVQHHQMRADRVNAMGMEETVRQAVRAKKWPTLEEARAASHLPGGFIEYQRAGCPGQTLHATMSKLTFARTLPPGQNAARYGLVPAHMANSLRPQTTSQASETSGMESLKSSRPSSTTPLQRAGCPMTATIMPRTGSAPSLGESAYMSTSGFQFSNKASPTSGFRSRLMSDLPAGGSDFKGFAGGGKGRYIGF